MRTLQSDAFKDLEQGWASTFSEGADAGVVAVLRQRVAGPPDFETAVLEANQKGAPFVLPYDNRNGLVTAFAVVNTSPTAVKLEITVRDATGNTLTVVRNASIDAFYQGAAALPDISRDNQSRRIDCS